MMSLNAYHAMELQDLKDAPVGFGLTEETQQDGEQSVTRFRVTDMEQANWCFRKLQALRANVAEIDSLAEKEIARINDWREKELVGLNDSIAYFEVLLKDFHEMKLLDDPKAKTITTPYGALKATTRKPSPKKVDDEQLLQHLKENGDDEFIVVKETPAWGEYKKTLRVENVNGDLMAIDQNGMPVAGVEIDLGGTSFKVEVSE